MGLRGPKKKRKDKFSQWLTEQSLFEGKTDGQIGRELGGISRQRVQQLRKAFGISVRNRAAVWYAKHRGIPELETSDWLLKQKGKDLGLIRLAKKLNLNPNLLRKQIIRLGLEPKDFLKRWTSEEENFIRENWKKMKDKQLAKHLGKRTERAVQGYRLRLGLRRGPDRRNKN